MKHYLAAIAGFSIWGTFALALRPLHLYTSEEIMYHRVVYASIGILITLLLFRRKEVHDTLQYLKHASQVAKKNLLLNVLASAVILSLNWYSYIYVMNHVSVKASSLAYLICPIVTTCLAFIFLGEKLSSRQKVALLICVISCVIMAYEHLIDLLYSVFVAFTYALYLTLQKKNQAMGKFITLAIHITLSAVFLLPAYLLIEPSTVPKSATFHTLIVVIAVVYTIIPLLLNMYALKGLNSSVVGSLLYINPIISFLLAVYYYDEYVATTQWVGFGLVTIAVILFNSTYFIRTNSPTLPKTS